MKKKNFKFTFILTALLVFSVITLSPKAGVCSQIFNDVQVDNKFCMQIEYLAVQKISESHACFRPERPITRAEFSQYIYTIFSFEKNNSGKVFTDLDNTNPFWDAISTLEYNGIVSGFTDGTFRPNEYITRAQAAKISVVAAIKNNNQLFKAEYTNINSEFSDVTENHSLSEYVNKITYASFQLNDKEVEKIMKGYSDGKFRPDNFILRQEASKLLANLIKYSKVQKTKCTNTWCEDKISTVETDNSTILYPDFLLDANLNSNEKVYKIGKSGEDRDILMHEIGNGCRPILINAGIHGDESNTSDLAYELLTYFRLNPAEIENVKILIVPQINPDGIYWGQRLNSNSVDINRNFDYDWQQATKLGSQTFPNGGGLFPFSEPETQSIKDLINYEYPSLIISYHSSGGFVSPNQLEKGYNFAQEYSSIAGYFFSGNLENNGFNYPITGDLDSWAGTLGIPAFVVELGTKTETDYLANINGINQILSEYE